MSADGVAAEDALEQHRVKLQRAVAGRARLRHTPVLEFRVDRAIETGSRVEAILSGLDIPPEEEADGEDEEARGHGTSVVTDGEPTGDA